MLKRLLKKLLTPVVQAVLREETVKLNLDSTEKTVKTIGLLLSDDELDEIFEESKNMSTNLN